MLAKINHPRVVPLKLWVHPSGRTASIWGAKPAGEDWEVREHGYTIRWSDGTEGIPYGASQRLGEDGRKDFAKVEAAMRNLITLGFRGFNEYTN